MSIKSVLEYALKKLDALNHYEPSNVDFKILDNNALQEIEALKVEINAALRLIMKDNLVLFIMT